MNRSVLLVDNYDSFTYNLVQLLGGLGADCRVLFNDDALLSGDLSWVEQQADAVLLSPGPGRPEAAAATPRVIAELYQRLPMLGVCLGHQAIAQHFGARVVASAEPLHGKTSALNHDGRGVFYGAPQGFSVARYHSLLVSPQELPSCLEVSAQTASGEIMALRHRELPIVGVQFHPESVLSECGALLLSNWLKSL